MAGEEKRDDIPRRQEDVERSIRLETSRLALLNSIRDLREDVDEVVQEQTRLRHIIEGDAESREPGLIYQIDGLDTDRNRLFAMLDPDHTGHEGRLYKVDTLWEERGKRVQVEGYRWKFWTAVVVGLPALIYALMDMGGKLWTFMQIHNKPTKIETMINHAEHPHIKHTVTRYIIAPPSDGDENQ